MPLDKCESWLKDVANWNLHTTSWVKFGGTVDLSSTGSAVNDPLSIRTIKYLIIEYWNIEVKQLISWSSFMCSSSYWKPRKPEKNTAVSNLQMINYSTYYRFKYITAVPSFPYRFRKYVMSPGNIFTHRVLRNCKIWAWNCSATRSARPHLDFL